MACATFTRHWWARRFSEKGCIVARIADTIGVHFVGVKAFRAHCADVESNAESANAALEEGFFFELIVARWTFD